MQEGLPSPLWQRVDEQNAKSVAIVGICKHAGKTTTMCRLIDDAQHMERMLALVSIGIDGERADAILGTPKPPIRVPQGTLVATAIEAQVPGSLRMEWLEPAEISSPLGEVWIGRVLTEGEVILAGVRQREHVLRAQAIFGSYGADYTLIDGALGRMVSVQPDIADGVIVAVGAAAGPMATVERLTRDVLQTITVPLADLNIRDAVQTLMQDLPSARDSAGIVTARLSTLERAVVRDARYWEDAGAFSGDVRMLMPPDNGRQDGESKQTLIICLGAVTDALMRSLTVSLGPVLLVARDPSRLFLTRDVWRAFLRGGHQLRVLRRASLLGITINPLAPRGPGLDRYALRERVQTLTDVPVWDVMDA